MRIAVGGFHIESSTYNPALSTEADFVIVRGPGLLDAPAFSFLAGFDAEFVPTFFARALPGPPIARPTYDAFKADFLSRLQQSGPIDGLYLALHGAANVEGMDDAEGDFAAAARAVVGPNCPISISLDLHGNVSQKLIDQIDMVSAYRTAPHIDVDRTMAKAVAMLMRSVDEGVRPVVCWCPIPVVLQGERTVTTAEPGKSLYARLPDIEDGDGIWDAGLMVGYVWADEPRVSAAALMTGTDRKQMETAAAAMGQAYWDAREQFVFGMPVGSTEECIAQAMASPTRPVFISDSGDNVTAGGPGDRADMLAALLAAGASDVIVAGIVDAPATAAAYGVPLGSEISVRLGATLDPAGSSPIALSARVVHRLESDVAAEREAILAIGSVRVVVTERRKAFTTRSDFARLGLDPEAAQIVVVKLGYLFPELAPLARPALMALSEGIVDQDVERLPRSRTPRPTFPFDRSFAFTPAVRWSARA